MLICSKFSIASDQNRQVTQLFTADEITFQRIVVLKVLELESIKTFSASL